LPEKITVLKDKILIICWASFSELLINTSQAWEHLKRLSGGRKTPIFKATVLSILFAGLVNFIGVSFVETDMDIFTGIKSGVTIIFSLFISVYISFFINIIALESITKKEAKLSELFNFTALLYSLPFLIYALEPILSLVFFYKIFLIYTFYIAWIGTEHFIEVPSDNRAVFTTISGISVIFTPIVISKILTLLMPGLT
jgi:hypothetical protein